MSAMVMNDQVFRTQCCNAANGPGFHANGKVHGAMHQPATIQVLGLFFKVADLAHPLQHPGQFFAWQFMNQAIATGC
jgi:hypothetical protein